MIYMVFDESVAQIACNTLNNHLFAGEFGLWAELSHTRSVEINSTSPKVHELAEKIAAQYGGRVQAENTAPWNQPVIDGVGLVNGGQVVQMERAQAKRKRTLETKESCLLSSLPYNERIKRRSRHEQNRICNPV